MFPASSPYEGIRRRDLRSPWPKRMTRTRIVRRMSTLVFTEEETRSSGEKGTRLISFRRHRPRVLDARGDETPRKRCWWTFYERSRPPSLAPMDSDGCRRRSTA